MNIELFLLCLCIKEYVNKVKIEIREEIRAGIEKDNILNAEDAQLINKFLIKLQREISNAGK